MKLSVDEKRINYLGEFHDRNLEKEFFQQHMQKSLRFIKPLMLMLALLNTSFLIPDYFLGDTSETFLPMAAGRLVFAFLVAVLYFRINKIKVFTRIAVYITLYEGLAVLLFLFVFCLYESPDYLIQTLGVIAFLIAVYMVPNRWIYAVGISVVLNTGFFIAVLNCTVNPNSSDLWAGTVYSWIILFLCSVVSFHQNHIERVQFVNRKELIRLSTTDPLSGAWNRMKLDEELYRQISISRRYNTPLSLAILDFDDFKKINDTYGHLVGDNVIREFSQIIRENIRQSDIFARWGGEEFILLLPYTDIEQAAELTERIRCRIERNVFTQAGKVTCSIGIAELTEEEDVSGFLKRADTSLYRAKEKGKNKVNI